ncbi:MAG: hypothetical protein PF503_23815 [Desulfobacula sp.]|jgi:hypothetical protein|nr:hypothetical protein [Desulfobacula sp.]
MKVFIFILFSVLFCQHAFAGDVLFLDINNAIPEIQVVQEYMDKEKTKKNGPESRLVIVPSYETYSMEKRQRIQELTAIMNGLKEKNILKPGGDFPRQIFNLGKVIRWVKTGDTDKDYKLSDFLPELKEVLNNDSYDFDRVFISGHHGSDYGSMSAFLGGEFFNGLTVDTLKKLLNNSPTTKNVNSLILLGCKTAINKLMERDGVAWAAVLPDSMLQFGFNETSPVKTDELNLSILRELLEIQALIGRYKNDQNSGISPDTILQRILKIKRGNRYLGFRFNNKYYQYPKHFVE